MGQQMPVKEIPVERNELQYTKLPVATLEAYAVAIGLQGAENVTHKKRVPSGIVKMKRMATDQVVTLNMTSGQITKITKQAAKVAAQQMKNSPGDVVPSRKETSTGRAGEKKSETERFPIERAGPSAPAASVDRSSNELAIDSDLRQVERDLEAGDMIWGMNVAKAMFQEMLDGMVISKSEEQPSMMLIEANSAEDPMGALCDPAKRSPDQTIVIKTRLRDTIAIIDATLCKPPHGHTCSRDCKSIRAQMCNEFTPCVNPTCRIWHDAEAHLEKCTNEQCEFRTRIKLRETMHLIEYKQQEIDDARDSLLNANTTLLSPSSKARTSVSNSEVFKLMDSLERDLVTFNHEQMDLIDVKLQHWDILKISASTQAQTKSTGSRTSPRTIRLKSTDTSQLESEARINSIRLFRAGLPKLGNMRAR
ncbi:hypothetical protein V7S43_015024 [Phytophthora oleae]|uniref:TRAF-type domain-containing protein n=1 Tax=Phytophthora oleae TaxID=2107226 RepID=A0ABD3EZY2_9STRA